MKSILLFGLMFIYASINIFTDDSKKILKEEIVEESFETNTSTNGNKNPATKHIIKNKKKSDKIIHTKSHSKKINKNKPRVKNIINKTSSRKRVKKIVRNYYIEKDKKKEEKTKEKIEPIEIVVKYDDEKKPEEPKSLKEEKPVEIKQLSEQKQENTASSFMKDYFLRPRHSGFYIAGGYGDILSQKVQSDPRFGIPLNSPNKNSFYFATGFTLAKIGTDLVNLFLNVEGFYQQFDASVTANALYNGSVAGTTVLTSNNFSVKYMLGGKARIGFTYSRLAFFATAGIGWSYITDSMKSITAGVDYYHSNQGFGMSILYGGGVDFLVTDWLFFRAEFIQTLIPFNDTFTGTQIKFGSSTAISYSQNYRMYMILIGCGIKLPF